MPTCAARQANRPLTVMWRRAQPADPAIYRDEVLDIIDALVDIKAWTYDIREYLLEDDEEEEEDA